MSSDKSKNFASDRSGFEFQLRLFPAKLLHLSRFHHPYNVGSNLYVGSCFENLMR